MHSFCTLFDSHYLSRGLTMYQSLSQHCADFHLYIFAFDDTCYQYLIAEQLDNVTVISLSDFEDEKLLAVKPDRSAVEYCWTCTPSVILYVLKQYKVHCCTYLDADLYFLSSPTVLIDEMADKSILLTEHRYSRRYDQSKGSGIYCVQFMAFKNDDYGLKALTWWRDACIDWCYARKEDGKLGDQKYLDDWLERFESVHSLAHLGGGVAPWNTQQYSYIKNPNVKGIKNNNGEIFDVIFYHFHGLKLFENNKICLVAGYHLDNSVRQFIYKPYIRKLLKNSQYISKKPLGSKIIDTAIYESKLWRLLCGLKFWIRGNPMNVYAINRYLD